ncbi:hypothetical protein [Acetobacter cerevisiae]|uniref:hypothetical protein n=1 Tax=Acetobacter cerevisiae TaxID=178900 RepID=UPI00209C7322|nr:hypothetical protein [Acetobacter cerevisiae]MCP1270561.1 hypothetical protein [Acetobacter cerevisiae]MCP1278515.1 hypothetical protein [Acetobacter cerevisiae]
MEVAISRVEKPPTDFAVTPFFRYETVEDVEASRREKRAVMKTVELCEMRIAGEKNYIPTVPADSIWKTENGQAITYAERFSEQYQQFKLGATQSGDGTPLQQLRPFGISDAQISLCRALRIYSIEAVHSLEGASLKALGVSGNELKRMANAWMAEQARGGHVVSELDALRRKVAELEAEKAAERAVAEEALEEAAADAEIVSAFSGMTEEQLKSYIKERTGAAPRGNPSRETLLRMAEEA